MAQKKFKIEIKISFIEKEIREDFTKLYVYHENQDKEYTDTISFTDSLITIFGNRTTKINPENDLYSPQSRLYRECISSLLYIYEKYGHFKIDSFIFNNYVVPEYNQKFTTKYDFGFSDNILNRLFHYKDDSLYIPLLHIIEGFNLKNYQLEHSWKSFNYIYNYITGKSKDAESIVEIINLCKNNKNHFTTVFQESKRIFFDKIDTGKIIFYLKYKTDNNDLTIEKFREYFKTRDIEDKELLDRLLDIQKKIFHKLQEDYDFNFKTGAYKLPNTKSYNDERKVMKKNSKKNLEELENYLPIVLDYIRFLRNKSMHGVLQSSAFLFETRNNEDQKKYAEFITLLSTELLKFILDAPIVK